MYNTSKYDSLSSINKLHCQLTLNFTRICDRCANLKEPDNGKQAESRAILLENVYKNIFSVQRKQKEAYDNNARPARYQVGQKVLKKNFNRRKKRGRKLDF